MNEKQFYTSPEVDVLVVRFEDNIMSPKRNVLNATEYFSYGIDYDYEEL